MSDTSAAKDRVEEMQVRIEAAYYPVQYAFVQFFTEHLAELVVAFDNDLTEVLVLAVIGQRRLEAREKGFDESHRGRICLTASRIADITHLPRQTVNRKLAKLKARGWIDNDPKHGWFIVGQGRQAPAREALSDFERRFAARLARMYVRLSKELDG
jgi:hypothetical protein